MRITWQVPEAVPEAFGVAQGDAMAKPQSRRGME